MHLRLNSETNRTDAGTDTEHAGIITALRLQGQATLKTALAVSYATLSNFTLGCLPHEK